MIKTTARAFALTALIGMVLVAPAQASLTAIWLGKDAATRALNLHVARLFTGDGGALDGRPSIDCLRQSAVVLQCTWRQGATAWTGDRYSICQSTYRIALRRLHVRLSLVPGTYSMCADAPFPDPFA